MRDLHKDMTGDDIILTGDDMEEMDRLKQKLAT